MLLVNKITSAIFCLTIALTVFPTFGEDGGEGYSPSVEYRRFSHSTIAGQAEVHVLKVDLSQPHVQVRLALARGRIGAIERTSSIAARHSAAGAINASFFDPEGVPLGMVMIDGKLLAEPILRRSVIGITEDGHILWDNPSFKAKITLVNPADPSTQHEIPLHGVNRKRRSRKETIIYTKEYVLTTPQDVSVKEITVVGGQVVFLSSGGKTTIPQTAGGFVISLRKKATLTEKTAFFDEIKLGDGATVDLNLKDGWENVAQAIGGGPRLVKDGEIIRANHNLSAQGSESSGGEDEGFQKDVSQSLAPRSAIGITTDGEILLVVVDGRRISSRGISLEGLAELMLELGAVEAMNLDGGGSSTMVYEGRVVNRPSDGFERPVSVALVVIH